MGRAEQRALISRARGATHDIPYYTTQAGRWQDALDRREETRGDRFKITVGERVYTKRGDGAAALEQHLRGLEKEAGTAKTIKPTAVGRIGGFPLVYEGQQAFLPNGRTEWGRRVALDVAPELMVTIRGSNPDGLITSAEHLVNTDLDRRRENALENAERARKMVADLSPQIGVPFPGEAKVRRLSKQVEDLRDELAGTPTKSGFALTAQTEQELAAENTRDRGKALLDELRAEYGDDDAVYDEVKAWLTDNDKDHPEYADMAAAQLILNEAATASLSRHEKYRKAAAGRPVLYSRFGTEDVVNRPFFSALTRGIEGVRQAKAPAQQWLGILKGLAGKGAKAEEVAWSGWRTGWRSSRGR